MKKIVRAFSTILILAALLVAIPTMSLADTTSVDVVKITAGETSSDWARFQFILNQPIKNGDVITFYMKSPADNIRFRYRGYSSGEALADETLGKGISTVSLGDGWYAIKVVVEFYDSTTGELNESYSKSKSFITLTTPTNPGDVVCLRNFTVNGVEKTNSELASMIVNDKKPAIIVEETTLAIDSNTVEYEWPAEDVSTFVPEIYEGTLPTNNAAPYTWKVNAALGGAQNLPAVNLAATGRYSNVTNVNEELIAALSTTTFVDPNNIIFIISDGMGQNGMKVSEKFGGSLIMNQMPYHGQSSTLSRAGSTTDTFATTDSAAGATALSSGYKTISGYEGIDVNQKTIPQITEALRQKLGKIIGVYTTGSAYDATPACFGGSHAIRGNNDEIVHDMMTFAPDLWIGSGISSYNATLTSLKKDYLAGQDIRLYTSWDAALTSKNDKLWISVGTSGSTSGISSSTLTISKAMAFSLKWLQAKSDANNNVGFFLMFENAVTDWAGHSNDFNLVVTEVQATDEAVAVALKFACENPDTLVLVTADHDTGGLTLKSGWETNTKKCVFTTTSHSQQLVAIRAIGKYGELFDGQTLHNCQIPKILTRVLGITGFGDPDEKYNVDEILKGVKVDDLGEMETRNDKPAGQILHVRTDAAATGLTVTFNDVSFAKDTMVAISIMVPSGVKTLKITNENGTVLVEQTLNKAMNYVADGDFYRVSFKAPASATKMVFVFTGSFALNDEVWFDNMEVGTAKTPFDGYDVKKVAATGKNTIMVYPSNSLPLLATPTPKPTSTPKPASTATPTPTVTATPVPTATPEPTVAPTPESTATPEPTVEPTVTPEPTAIPAPTEVPTAEPTATIAPEVTATPKPTEKPAEQSSNINVGKTVPIVVIVIGFGTALSIFVARAYRKKK